MVGREAICLLFFPLLLERNLSGCPRPRFPSWAVERYIAMHLMERVELDFLSLAGSQPEFDSLACSQPMV
jgi:hypothetical protein